MNKVVQRYLAKLRLDANAVPTSKESWQSLIEMISVALDQSDTDRRMMEHSLEIVSTEMNTLYENLKLESEKLRQSQKMEAIGSLAGGVAHDFNNLLSIIYCCSDLALSKLDDSDPLFQNFQTILHAAKRGSDLTRQLLAFSRRQVLQPKVLDPRKVVLNMNDLLGRLIGETIKFSIEAELNISKILIDQGQLEQVVMNLVVNSRDAISWAGEIEVRLHNLQMDQAFASTHLGSRPCPKGNGVMIEIMDTGAGMTPETKLRIFEPFFTTKEIGKGTGLGLATVLGIVEQSNGGIFVDSTVGKGTVFRIFFPETTQIATELDKTASQQSANLRGTETILLVEDETELLRVVFEILKQNGYDVRRVNSAQEALQITTGDLDKIDLVLTDVIMPEMSGEVLVQQLRYKRPSLGVLFMSGYTDDARLKYDIESSKVAFIQKPFASVDLLLKVRELLSPD